MPVFYRKDMMPMSQFSELLKEYIKKKDITIKALAEKCGIDRTYLHKILKGERKVPSVDFVENISLQLMLSTEDKSRLMELYNISEMGEDVNNRRKQVKKTPQNTIWIFFRSYVTLRKSMKNMRLFIIMRVRRHISTPRTSCQT